MRSEVWGVFQSGPLTARLVKNLRLANVPLTVLEVLAEAHGFHPGSVRLCPQKDNDGLHDLVGHLTVVCSHALLQIMHHALDWDLPIREDIAAAN